MSRNTKYALDNNALSTLCSGDEPCFRTVLKAAQRGDIELFINRRVIEEFNNNPRLTSTEIERLGELIEAYPINERQFFTIGLSSIGGPDVLAGGDAYDALDPCHLDTRAAYEEYKRRSPSPKSPERWIRKTQGDAAIYAMATLEGCDYFVTDDQKLTSRVSKIKGPVTIPMDAFMTTLKAIS